MQIHVGMAQHRKAAGLKRLRDDKAYDGDDDRDPLAAPSASVVAARSGVHLQTERRSAGGSTSDDDSDSICSTGTRSSRDSDSSIVLERFENSDDDDGDDNVGIHPRAVAATPRAAVAAVAPVLVGTQALAAGVIAAHAAPQAPGAGAYLHRIHTVVHAHPVMWTVDGMSPDMSAR